jgi:hypothetical protein
MHKSRLDVLIEFDRKENLRRSLSVQQLREMKRRYETMLALARSYANHFANLMSTQRILSRLLAEETFDR